ncbi:MAG TPA: DUF3168 domain-containing protein [Pirellulales bacterium]
MSDPIEAALIARLKATAAVTAIVGQRVYGETSPQKATLPFVTVTVDRDARETHGKLVSALATVNCRAKDAAGAGALAAAVASLHGYRGPAAGVAVRGIFDEGWSNIDDADDAGGELGVRGRGVQLRVFAITN